MKSKSVKGFCRDHELSRPTFYKEVHAGRLKTILVGRTRRVPDEYEAEWIERCAERGRQVEPVKQLVEARARAEMKKGQQLLADRWPWYYMPVDGGRENGNTAR